MTTLPVLEEVVPVRAAASVERSPRAVPEEQPIAIVCNGTTLAVLMATPADLADFGVGFLISEGTSPGWAISSAATSSNTIRAWKCAIGSPKTECGRYWRAGGG